MGNPNLAAKSKLLLPFQRQPSFELKFFPNVDLLLATSSPSSARTLTAFWLGDSVPLLKRGLQKNKLVPTYSNLSTGGPSQAPNRLALYLAEKPRRDTSKRAPEVSQNLGRNPSRCAPRPGTENSRKCNLPQLQPVGCFIFSTFWERCPFKVNQPKKDAILSHGHWASEFLCFFLFGALEGYRQGPGSPTLSFQLRAAGVVLVECVNRPCK